MASKALTKEVRAIVSSKATAARKRMNEANAFERIVAVGSSPVGSGLAAVLDHYDVGIPMGGARKIPLSPVGAAVGILVGLNVKGAVGAAALGFGVGQLDGLAYKLTRDMLEGGEPDDQG